MAPLAVLDGETVPHPGEHAVPFCVSIQVTPRLDGSFATVAVKPWAIFSGRIALTGVPETLTAPTVIPAKFDAAGLNTEDAVTVTGMSLAGGVPEAV